MNELTEAELKELKDAQRDYNKASTHDGDREAQHLHGLLWAYADGLIHAAEQYPCWLANAKAIEQDRLKLDAEVRRLREAMNGSYYEAWRKERDGKEAAVDQFIDALTTTLESHGLDTTNWDGDDAPHVIIANGIVAAIVEIEDKWRAKVAAAQANAKLNLQLWQEAVNAHIPSGLKHASEYRMAMNSHLEQVTFYDERILPSPNPVAEEQPPKSL